YHKGLYAAAVQHLETAAAAGGAVCKYHLAMAYFRAGEKTRARATLDAALRLDPNVPEAKMARELIAGAEASSSLSGARLPR
ncbi:MAG: tetratricopeptide repeat protein, partial [bacterium]